MFAAKIHTVLRTLLVVTVTTVTLATAMMGASPVYAAKKDIPAGCPGATISRQQEIDSGVSGQKITETCDKNNFPGCPGYVLAANQKAPKKTPSNCPYNKAAPKDTTGGSGSSSCDQNDAFSTCCATNGDSKSNCVATYCSDSSNGVTDCSDPAASCTGTKCDLIQKYLNPTIILLSGLVGVVVVISLILGGIQYATSGGDPQKVSAAKGRITKTIVALVSYVFLYALVQFLIPGGVK